MAITQDFTLHDRFKFDNPWEGLHAVGIYEITAEFAGDDLHQSSTATALGAVYDREGGLGGNR